MRQYVGCIIKWRVEIRGTDIEDYLRDVPFYELDQMYRMSLSSRPRPPRLLMHSTIYAEHFYLSSRTSFTLLLRRNKFLLLASPIALRLSDVNRWRSSFWYAGHSCTNEFVTNGIARFFIYKLFELIRFSGRYSNRFGDKENLCSQVNSWKFESFDCLIRRNILRSWKRNL